MLMIVAVVRPEKLQCLKDALRDAGAGGMTITHVTGRGKSNGIVFTNRVGQFQVDELEKVKVEVVTEDGQAEDIIDVIRRVADTGHPGDGRIFILPVEQSIKIRSSDASDEN